MRRTIALIVAAATLAVAAATPVWAHGGPNVEQSIQSLVINTPPGVRVWVHADGSLITVESGATTEPVTVLGYRAEPFLRLAGDAVLENKNSLTTYATRSGLLNDVPVEAGHGPVTWQRVRAGSSFSWSDERVTWTDGQLPADVMADPGHRHEMGAWSIPVRVAGTSSVIGGHFVWIPNTMPAGATMAFVLGFIAVVLGLASYAAFPRRTKA